LSKAVSGTGSKFGGEDTDYINQLLTGTDQSGSDSVDINTTWKFRTAKMRLLESGGSPTDYASIATSAISGSDKTVTLPLLTADDTFALDQTTQTLTNKTIPGGSAATEGTNNYIADVILYPGQRKFTGWLGGSNNNSAGFGQGNAVTVGSSAHSVSASGKYITWSTSTAQNGQAGWRNDSAGALNRNCNPTFTCRFKLNDSGSAVRFGVYWNTQSTFPTGGSDDPLGSAQGLGLFKRSTDNTTFVLGHRGSNGTNVYGSTGINIDTTGAHVFRMKGDNANSAWYYSWDNGAWSAAMTGNDYPSTSTVYPSIYIELTDTSAVAKSFDLFWLICDQMEYP
jgi:hypothetical protein